MTRFKLSAETRFLRIPTQWAIRQVEQQAFYTRSQFNYPDRPRKKRPTVSIAIPSFTWHWHDKNYRLEGDLVEVDGWELRNRFLQMEQSDSAALSFLQEVGVWEFVEDQYVSRSEGGGLVGGFGGRYLHGWAVPVTLPNIWEVQRHYREVLGNPSQLRQKFGPPPSATAPTSEKVGFALVTDDENTLPMHIEWRGGHATAVAETITWQEMATATIQIDLLEGARFRYCRRKDCHIPFAVTTKHHKVYCSWYCAHIETVRKDRRERRKPKRRKLS